MAVHQETVVRGRRVWMDFLRNPVGLGGWEEFRLDRLGKEALEYLEKTGAMQATPIERLEHMNPPAIAIYRENGIDLFDEPLEIAVCAQHNNGGFAVSKWWESNLRHTFVVGEMAGTHGVKRPGGSALNAGQTGGLRAAEYIARVYGADLPKAPSAEVKAGLAGVVADLKGMLARGRQSRLTAEEAMREIGRRMTRCGAHIRWRSGASEALDAAMAQYRRLQSEGLKVASPRQLPAAVRMLQQCLTQVAMLKAICAMFDRNVGSRGSHCILDESGIEMHPALIDPATGQPYRFKEENVALRQQILYVAYNEDAPDLFEAWDVAPRPIPDRQVAFEPAWTEYREGSIYKV
jgi:succinate dehydrogenase/fumarate reductase flavoprotein subunit